MVCRCCGKVACSLIHGHDARALVLDAPPAFEAFEIFGGKWGASTTFGTSGGVVTWSVATAGWANQSGVPSFFTGLTVDMSVIVANYEAALVEAFAAWSDVADITFVKVADGGGDFGVGATANIRIGAAFQDGPNNVVATAFSPPDGTAWAIPIHGDIIFDSGESSFWTYDSFKAVAIHEIGHAIGLRHTNVAGSIMLPFYDPAITSPQADDIAGAVFLYGAPRGTGTLTISDATVLEGNLGTKVAVFTVTRSGGSGAFTVNFATSDGTATAASGDYVATSGTLSFGAGVNQRTIQVTINSDTFVEPDEQFYVGIFGATGGVVIADAVGVGTILNDDFVLTAGADIVTLPTPNATWHALGGNDSLTGTSSQDVLVGGAGADTLDGGGGFDLVDHSHDAAGGGTAGVYVDLANGFAQDGFGTYDRLLSIEGAIGTNGLRAGSLSDVLIGNAFGNYFDGRGGLDYIVGGAGNDTIFTGDGDPGPVGDIVVAGPGNDSVVGGTGATFIYGGDGSDTLYGGPGDDWLFGGDFTGTVTGFDILLGGEGNDVLAVGSAGGAASMYGGNGNDTIYGGTGAPGNDIIRGGAGSDYAYGGLGADTFRFEALDLQPGDFDQIVGFGSDDYLSFAASLSGQINGLQTQIGGISGAYLFSGGGWALWMPYTSWTSVQTQIVYA